MKIIELHRGKWEIQTAALEHPFVFTVGSASKLVSVVQGDVAFTIHYDGFDGGLILLGDLYKQMALGALPYVAENYQHLTLFRAIERTLQSLGVQVHLQEYGDEESDFRAISSEVCFVDGKFEHIHHCGNKIHTITLKKEHSKQGIEIHIETHYIKHENKGDDYTYAGSTTWHRRVGHGEVIPPLDIEEIRTRLDNGTMI